jgi:hypothetical protein
VPHRTDTDLHSLSRRASFTLAGLAIIGFAGAAVAQPFDVRQWQGASAVTRQPGQVVAATQAEWRSLWSRVGQPAPDIFEPGRTTAVGIFLGPRAEGASVNLLSTTRRRDRIVVVFDERADTMMAQRAPGPARPVAGGPLGSPPPGGAGFAAPSASVAPPMAPPGPGRNQQLSASPWAIVLINRADLPLSVEQRLFR